MKGIEVKQQRSKIELRTVTAVLTATLTGATLAACGSNSESGTTSRANIAIFATAGTDLQTLNTHLSTSIGPSQIAGAWADGLWGYGPDGTMEPRLATSWEWSDDETTLTFHLREGVKWSDGQPFSAEDVVFSLLEAGKLNPYFSTVHPLIESAEATDASTVVVKLKRPFGPFLRGLNAYNFPILPKHVYEGTDIATSPANTNPVGLGPFRLKEWKSGVSIEFERNPYYWQEGKPYLDGVIFKFIPAPAQQINALKAGEVDWANVPISHVKDVRGDSRLRLYTNEPSQPNHMSIDLNVTREPFSNPLVRKALLMAIDRDRIAEVAFEGTATPAVSPIPPEFKEFYTPSVDYRKMYPYDPEAAGKLLDEAGYPLKDGKRFSLEYYFMTGKDDQTPYTSVARLVSAMWEEIGVEVHLKGVDTAIFLQEVYEKRNFDVSEVTLTTGTDPSFGVDRNHRCNDSHNAYVNPTGYCNPELEAIINEARSASEKDRPALYARYAEIVAEDLPQLILTNQIRYFAISDRFDSDATTGLAYVGAVKYEELKLK